MEKSHVVASHRHRLTPQADFKQHLLSMLRSDTSRLPGTFFPCGSHGGCQDETYSFFVKKVKKHRLSIDVMFWKCLSMFRNNIFLILSGSKVNAIVTIRMVDIGHWVFFVAPQFDHLRQKDMDG
jgi:hypothetical protein